MNASPLRGQAPCCCDSPSTVESSTCVRRQSDDRPNVGIPERRQQHHDVLTSSQDRSTTRSGSTGDTTVPRRHGQNDLAVTITVLLTAPQRYPSACISSPIVVMSATSHVASPVEAGAIAYVNFRVRCEKLGHGEDVYLLQEGDVKRQKVRLTDETCTGGFCTVSIVLIADPTCILR